MTQSPEMVQFAKEQIVVRLGKLAFEIRRTSQTMDADTIHDLRVAVRRFGQSVTVFESLLPSREVKRIRKRLKRLMETAGAIRDYDIACEFLDDAGLPAEDPLRKNLMASRRQAELDLRERIQRWNRKAFSAKWRSGLQLDR